MSPKAQRKADEMVKLDPVPGVYIEGVPAVPCEVTAKEAEVLLGYSPPAFTTDPPDVAVDEQGPASAGPSDSAEV